jgi:hypothetical protein
MRIKALHLLPDFPKGGAKVKNMFQVKKVVATNSSTIFNHFLIT